MVTVIVGDNCPSCHKLTEHLKDKNIEFTKLHRDSTEAQKLIRDRGLSSIPVTIFKKGFVDIMKIGYSNKIVNEIVDIYNNAN